MAYIRHLPPYRYDSLAAGNIRLLEVEPGQPSCDLRLSLYAARLDTHPRYVALSYVWGKTNNTEVITCNGCSMDITKSLANTLRQFRRPHEALVIWVDAICINQKDIAERNYQVTLMGTIYRRAEEVLIWLGEDSVDNAELAFHGVEEYLEQSRSQVASLSQDTGSFDYRELRAFAPNEGDKGDEMLANAVADIFSRPWFSRTWVLQEVGLAAKATAFCGSAATSFENLVTFAAVIGYTSHKFAPRIPAWEIREAYDCMWATYQTGPSWRDRMPLQYHKEGLDKVGFVDILHTSLRRGATDKRDHIYSLLGHPSALIARSDRPIPETLVQPNYSISFQELSRQLARSLLANNQDPTILSLVQHGSPTRFDELEARDIASWIPDLELKYPVIDHIVFGPGAGGCASASISLSSESDCIEILGLFIDDIDWTSELLQQSDFQFNVKGKDQAPFTPAVSKVRQRVLESSIGNDTLTSPTHLEALALVLCCRALRVPSNFSTHKARADQIRRLVRGFEAYLQLSEYRSKADDITKDIEDDILHFLYWAKRFCPRKVFHSKEGYLGLGPAIMSPHDRCCIFFGSRVPSIIRPVGFQGKYRFVGECYVYGLMEGEALGQWGAGRRKEANIVLC